MGFDAVISLRGSLLAQAGLVSWRALRRFAAEELFGCLLMALLLYGSIWGAEPLFRARWSRSGTKQEIRSRTGPILGGRPCKSL